MVPKPGWVDEPALLKTTQSTIPLLTTLLSTFSLGALGYISSNATISNGFSNFSIMLSGLLFIISTWACVKSHAWDFSQVSEEFLEQYYNVKLFSKDLYFERCCKRVRFFHKVAVILFWWGYVLLLFGIAFLFNPQGNFEFSWVFSKNGLPFGLSIIFILLNVLCLGITRRYKDRTDKMMRWLTKGYQPESCRNIR